MNIYDFYNLCYLCYNLDLFGQWDSSVVVDRFSIMDLDNNTTMF